MFFDKKYCFNSLLPDEIHESKIALEDESHWTDLKENFDKLAASESIVDPRLIGRCIRNADNRISLKYSFDVS